MLICYEESIHSAAIRMPLKGEAFACEMHKFKPSLRILSFCSAFEHLYQGRAIISINYRYRDMTMHIISLLIIMVIKIFHKYRRSSRNEKEAGVFLTP